MHNSKTTLNKDWLDARFAFDCAARNQKVEKACLDFLSKKEKVAIVDIGSGTGSNFLYLFEKIKPAQSWVFVEQDENLCQHALKRIEKLVAEKKYPCTLEGNLLKMYRGDTRIEVRCVAESFFEIEKITDLSEVDLVTAGAVLDLLSFNQFLDIASVLFDNQVAFFSTLNYHSMSFYPEELGDQFFVEKYEQHMVREQDFGKAMGNKCSRLMVDFFQKKESEVQFGKSVWNLNGNGSQKIYEHLLQFMSGAVSEVLEEEDQFDKLFFEEWLMQKKTKSASGELNLDVNHYDIFVVNDW